MTKQEIIDQLMPFDDETEIVIRNGNIILHFESLKYGFHNDYGTLFIDISEDNL